MRGQAPPAPGPGPAALHRASPSAPWPPAGPLEVGGGHQGPWSLWPQDSETSVTSILPRLGPGRRHVPHALCVPSRWPGTNPGPPQLFPVVKEIMLQPLWASRDRYEELKRMEDARKEVTPRPSGRAGGGASGRQERPPRGAGSVVGIRGGQVWSRRCPPRCDRASAPTGPGPPAAPEPPPSRTNHDL